MSGHIGHTVVVDTSETQHTCLKPFSLTFADLTNSFWAPRLRINRDITLPT